MKIPNVELSELSRRRGELMGAAMIFIMLFHLPQLRQSDFYGLQRMGNIGVDMFLFLSGVGLWYSWTKRPALMHFWAKRAVRIYPIWLVVAGWHYIGQYVHGGGYSTNIGELIGNLLVNWTFWKHGDLAFWFVPAILAFYVLAPFYMQLIRRNPVYRWLPVLMIAWCFAVEYVPFLRQHFFQVAIFWQRMAIFFIGVNMAESIRRKDTVAPWGWWLIALLFADAAVAAVYFEQMYHGRMPLLVIRLLYIPMTVCGMLLLVRLFAVLPAWVNCGLRFVGSISLECYLVHEEFVRPYIKQITWGFWPQFLVLVGATLPLAWVAHKILSLITSPIERKL